MVGFNKTATVTFVPYFAAAPTSPEGRAADCTEVPKSLSRTAVETDRMIALRVAHALAELQVPILRTLEVAVEEGRVTLRGRVRTYLERQLARVNAKRVPGVVAVREEISIAG